MDANDLEDGYRLGDWVVEPRLGCITSGRRSRALGPHHVRILQLLAANHGDRPFDHRDRCRAASVNLGTLYYYQKRFPDSVKQYESAQALALAESELKVDPTLGPLTAEKS
jgi:hypothetical protein